MQDSAQRAYANTDSGSESSINGTQAQPSTTDGDEIWLILAQAESMEHASAQNALAEQDAKGCDQR